MRKILISFSIACIISVCFCSLISAQDKNWKNHKMTYSDFQQMGAEYKMLSIDEALEKFVNDMQYLPKLFPLLMKNATTSKDILDIKDIDTSSFYTNRQNAKTTISSMIKVNQYFTSLKDDSLAISYTIKNDHPSMIRIQSIDFTHGYADEAVYAGFQKRDSNTAVLGTSSLLDSVQLVAEVEMVSHIDSIVWDINTSHLQIGTDTLYVSRLNEQEINVECPSSLFNHWIANHALSISNQTLAPDSINIQSPILEYNYINTMSLLGEFQKLSDSILLDISKYDTKEAFIGSLDSILSDFQVTEVEDRYSVKLFYPSPVEKIIFYFTENNFRDQLKLTLPLRN